MNMTRRHFLRASIASPFLLVPSLWSKSSTGKSPVTKSELKVLLRLRKCIAQVETGDNDDVPGKKGERSRYQISWIVWKQHYPGRPFIECYGINADECAIKHLTWIYENLKHHDKWSEFPVLWIAYAWNTGLSATITLDEAPRFGAHNFAMRVNNLYLDKNFK